MALDPNRDRGEAIEEMLASCTDHIFKLSDWEQDFLISVQDQFERNGDLSQKQVDKLEQIYCKLP